MPYLNDGYGLDKTEVIPPKIIVLVLAIVWG
jgi:hypothetical protein